MDKVNKNCCVRLSEDMHRKAKLEAYRQGKTLQNWIGGLINEKLNSPKTTCRLLCEACGQWTLKSTQLALIDKCESCGKEDTAVFPCWEKK